MKVYMRKEDGFNPVIVVSFLFFVFTAVIVYSIYTYYQLGDFSLWFAKHGGIIPFDIVFLFFDIILIFYVFKKPKKVIATLVQKEDKKYKGKLCHTLLFESNQNQHYKCYTKEENPFVVDKSYFLFIKELNWSVRSVEEPDDTLFDQNEPSKFDQITQHPKFPLYFSIGIAGFILFCFIILCIIGIFMYPDYSIYYLIFIILLIIGILSAIPYIRKK